MPSMITAESFDLVFGEFSSNYKNLDELIIVREWMVPKTLLCAPNDEVKAAFSNIKGHLNDLIVLYMNDVRCHFYKHACPVLNSLIHADPFTHKEAFRLTGVLRDLKRHYFYPFEFLEVADDLYQRFYVCYSSLLNRVFSPQIFSSVVSACFKGYNLCYPDQSILDALETLREIGKESSLNQLILSRFLEDVESMVRNKYKQKWNLSVLKGMREWIDTVVVPSVHALIPQHDEDISSLIINFSSEVLAALRTEELFDIVVDYPDSRPGLEDLKVTIIDFVEIFFFWL